MIPYSRPKLSDLYTLSQSKLLENHTLHSGTYYPRYGSIPSPPPEPRVFTIYRDVTYRESACIKADTRGLL